jgi:glycogen(starch) synthase
MAAAPLRVLRICSVFEPPDAALTPRGARFDPIGGMQNHAAQLTRALDRRGVRQTVLTTRPPGAPVVTRSGRLARVVRVGLPVPHLRQCYAVPAAPLAAVLAARADLVHVHLGEDLAAYPIALAAARLHGLPLVLTLHTSLRHTLAGVDVRSRFLRLAGGALERAAVRAADGVIVLTPRLAALAARDGGCAPRVIPSGVNPAEFAGPFDDPLPAAGRPRVLYVGRLAAQKDVATLVRAAALLRAPAAQVVLAGDGPQREALERLALRLGVAGRVRFLGFRPHREVPALLAHADVLVMPSVYEELGSALVEGLQAGVPIVATRVGGIPDAVGDAGVLVEPRDPAALARAIDDVLSRPALAGRLRAAAERRRAAYDWNALAGRVLDVYREAVRRRAARRRAR